MKKLIYLISFFVGLLLQVNVKAQDAHFSQYYASSLYLNPAMSGVEPGLTLGLNHRNQWRSIVIPYVTSQVSLIAPIYISKLKHGHLGGVGLSVFNDRAGDGKFNTLGANLNFSYNLHLSSLQRITFGLHGGIIQKSLDFSNLQWGEQFNPFIGFDATISPSETTISSNKLYPDFGAGFIYSFEASEDERTFTGFLGGSAYHLNKANESLVKSQVSYLPMLFKVHAGVEVPLGEKLSISPNILGMMQNDVYHINSGLYFSYQINDSKKIVTPSEIILGSWYRLKDSFIFFMGVGSKNYLLGFSYDFNSSSLRYETNGRGAYEISLTIRKVKARASVKRFHTPRI